MCECEEEWEEEEEGRRGAEVASKNKNPTLRMWEKIIPKEKTGHKVTPSCD